MTRGKFKLLSLITALSGMLLLASCNKQVAKVTPPPPPPPAAPTATLAANPDVIQQGQSTILTWQTTSASDITISGLGTVPASGLRLVMPNTSTTYTLVAEGPGGTRDASARVSVTPVPAAKAPQQSEEDLFAENVKDLFFDFNKANIRPDEVPVTDNDAKFIEQHPDIKITVEGHCDDRGSEEYNLALGDRRAHSLKEALEKQGVSADRITTISYGKEKPFCTTDSEQCWQANRRDHFVLER